MTGGLAFVEAAPGTVLVDDGGWEIEDQCTDRWCWICHPDDNQPHRVFRWAPGDPVFVPAALAADLARARDLP